MWTGVLLLSLAAAALPAGPPLQRASTPDCQTWQACRDAVEAALGEESFERALDLAWRAVQTGPTDDPALLFLLARAQSRAGRPQDALVMVRRLAERGVATDAASHPDLERMRTLDGWGEVEALAGRGAAGAPPSFPTSPIARPPTPVAAPPTAPATSTASKAGGVALESGTLSGEVLRFAADRFVPAGLAYDGVSRRYVMGDEQGRKLRVAGEGLDHAVDLVRAESAGFLDIRALAIDPRRGDLWVVTSDGAGASGLLHRIQLISGRPLQSVSLVVDANRTVQPVDVAVAGEGVVFVLDRDGRLLRTRAGGTSLETVVTLTGISSAFSLALAGDAVAYVSHDRGMARVDLRKGTAAEVTPPAALPLMAIERLRAHRNGFVALQRGPDDACRLLRFELSRNGRSVRAATSYDVCVSAGSNLPALAISGDEVSLVTSDAGLAEANALPSPLGAPADLVVRRFRLP